MLWSMIYKFWWSGTLYPTFETHLSMCLNLDQFKTNKVIICILCRYKPFRKLVNGATPSLKLLTQTFLGIEIQSGEHSSVSFQFFISSLLLPGIFYLFWQVQDAQAAMRLYTMVRQNWETDLSSSRKDRKGKLLKMKSEKMKKKKPEIKVVEEEGESDDDLTTTPKW